MITACKAHVSDSGASTIWTQEERELLGKLGDCVRLNTEYQACFMRVKERLASTPGERPFEFSELCIFGKFDAFCRRCHKIVDMFATIGAYSRLKSSRVEGLAPFAVKFDGLVTQLRCKTYDFLDQRQTDFDADYDEFTRAVADLHAALHAFVDAQLERMQQQQSTERALTLSKRIDALAIPRLDTRAKYARVLQQYARDIDQVARIYQRSRLEPPPVGHDLPPTAGRILWSRQLFKRLQQPMNVFQTHPAAAGILDMADARAVVRKYNRMSRVLVEYELLYHRTWLEQCSLIVSGLHVSLLLRRELDDDDEPAAAGGGGGGGAPSTARRVEYHVNLDMDVMALIREAECMQRLGLHVPEAVVTLAARKDALKHAYERVKRIVDDNRAVRVAVPHTFRPLVKARLARIDQAIGAGCFKITWSSPNVDDWCTRVLSKIERFALTVQRAKDIVAYRVDVLLDEIARLALFAFNEPTSGATAINGGGDDGPMTIDEFYAKTSEMCERGARTLATKTENVEMAVLELVKLLCPDYADLVLEFATAGQPLSHPAPAPAAADLREHSERFRVNAYLITHPHNTF